MNKGKPITFGAAPTVRATNLDITGVTATSAVLTCQGDGGGGDAVWSVTGPGDSFNATTPNGYECSVIATPLTPNTSYSVSVVVNGAAALNDSFTTADAPLAVQSGIQPLRRRSF